MKIAHRLLPIMFLLTITVSVFCQGNDKGYIIDYPYTIDSTGEKIVKNCQKYLSISNNDYTSWGYIDSVGNMVIPLGKYRFLSWINDSGMIRAEKDGKQGYIDINETVLIPFIYDDLGYFYSGVDFALAVKNNKQGLINRKGEIIIPFEYDNVPYERDYFYKNEIAVLSKNKKYGVINTKNQIIIPFIYDAIDFRWEKNVFIAKKNNKWACFSTDGKQLSKFTNYKIIEGYPPPPENSKNLPVLITTKKGLQLTKKIEYWALSKKDKQAWKARSRIKYAYLDTNYNKKIVPFRKYDYAEVFGLGRKAIVAKKGKYGIIDEYGKVVLPLEYDFVEHPSTFMEGYANFFAATKHDTVFLFDENTNKIPTADIATYSDMFSGCLFVTNRENKMGRIDYHDGKQTIPFLYDTLYSDGELSSISKYIAKKDGFYGYISKNNEIIQPFQYKYIYSAGKNIAYIDQHNKVGIIDKNGNIAIPFEYDAIYNTNKNNHYFTGNTMYIVEKEGKIGTVDNENKVIIPIIYDGLTTWNFGEIRIVKNNGKYGLISHTGEIAIPIEYDFVGVPQGGVLAVMKNGKYGVISLENKEILPCIYDKIVLDVYRRCCEEAPEPKIVVLQQKTWKYYDLNGKLLKSKVPFRKINKEYDYKPNWNETANEYYYLMQKGGVKRNL